MKRLNRPRYLHVILALSLRVRSDNYRRTASFLTSLFKCVYSFRYKKKSTCDEHEALCWCVCALVSMLIWNSVLYNKRIKLTKKRTRSLSEDTIFKQSQSHDYNAEAVLHSARARHAHLQQSRHTSHTVASRMLSGWYVTVARLPAIRG